MQPDETGQPPRKRTRKVKLPALYRRSPKDCSVSEIEAALLAHDGSILRAAEALRLDRVDLHQHVQRYPALKAAKRTGAQMCRDRALDRVEVLARAKDRWALQVQISAGQREDEIEREENERREAVKAWQAPVMVIAEIRAGDMLDPKTGLIITKDEAYAQFLETFAIEQAARREAMDNGEEVPEREPDERVEAVMANVVRLRRDIPTD